MAERQGGLGSSGADRARRNIGGQIGGNHISAYEREMFGRPRSTPPAGKTSWEYPDSTRVHAYAYDFKESNLWVRFKKYDTPWLYSGVTQPVFSAFDASPSKGKFINATLNYTNYRRATPQEEAATFDD
jgi:hypothetical protein